MGNLATDPRLLDALKVAAQRPVSAAELRSQRVGYIVSSLSDGEVTITAEHVERELRRLEGTK